jgi:hypothetical protein
MIKSFLSNLFYIHSTLTKKYSSYTALHLVTAITIRLYAKGLFALYVTGAARSPFLHLLHRDSLVFRRRKVEFDMAIAALIQAGMKFVAEFDVPRILKLEIYILGGMALRTVFRLKCPFAVMTGTTGFPLFHLSHSDNLF